MKYQIRIFVNVQNKKKFDILSKNWSTYIHKHKYTIFYLNSQRSRYVNQLLIKNKRSFAAKWSLAAQTHISFRQLSTCMHELSKLKNEKKVKRNKNYRSRRLRNTGV